MRPGFATGISLTPLPVDLITREKTRNSYDICDRRTGEVVGFGWSSDFDLAGGLNDRVNHWERTMHKHRPYAAEELESALDEGNVTLERLAATLVGLMPGKVRASAPTQNTAPAKSEPVHGAKR